MAEQTWCVVVINGFSPPDEDENVYEIREPNEDGVTITDSPSLTREDADSIVADHNALLGIPDPEAFMSAHDKLVAVCDEVFAPDTWLMEDRESDYDAGAVYDIVKPIAEALAAVKEASDGKAD